MPAFMVFPVLFYKSHQNLIYLHFEHTVGYNVRAEIIVGKVGLYNINACKKGKHLSRGRVDF